jgi:hypothetical protein
MRDTKSDISVLFFNAAVCSFLFCVMMLHKCNKKKQGLEKLQVFAFLAQVLQVFAKFVDF